MNKTAIKNFAVWARVSLIESIKQKAYEYEITESAQLDANASSVGGRLLTSEEKAQRKELVNQIKFKGYTQVMEEVAYTWFNRFIALRFMEVNNYLPSRVRVFTDENGDFKPEILKEAMNVELEGLDKSYVLSLLDKSNTDELYKYLIITQCNSLSSGLPGMFEKISNYTELLFPNNILRNDSVIARLVNDIPNDDWLDAVQIIGWMYQYYNAELKDDTFAKLKKNLKISKDRIPAATQLFTPDWIVRYMVENSLGRTYIEYKLSSFSFDTEENRVAKEKELADQMKWKYYISEAEQKPEVRAKLNEINSKCKSDFNIENLKVIDPCMGSGHVLVYAFDVLMQIYLDLGFTERDAAKSILENNLYGLDIDDRAGQLAYFAVMMKARKYNRRILVSTVYPSVMAIQESNGINSDYLSLFGELKDKALILMENMKDAKEYGSIIQVKLTLEDLLTIKEKAEEIKNYYYDNFFDTAKQAGIVTDFIPLINQAIFLVQKYDIVVTNPPYMGSSGMSAKLSEFVKNNYPDSKSDLFAVFIEKCGKMIKANGYQAMVTMHSWMFLQSFEILRSKVLSNITTSLIHLGSGAFDNSVGTIVQTVAFVQKKYKEDNYLGTYYDLTSLSSKIMQSNILENPCCKYHTSNSKLKLLPSYNFAYWTSDSVQNIFKKIRPLSSYGDTRQGMATSDNKRFIRFWCEVDYAKIDFDRKSSNDFSASKWFPYNKGGEFRKWYGSNFYILNYESNGKELLEYAGSLYGSPTRTIKSISEYFKQCVTWPYISTNDRFGARFQPYGFIFDVAGSSLFSKEDDLKYLCGLLCTKLSLNFLRIINPTMNYQSGDIARIPVLIDDSKKDQINSVVDKNIYEAKKDWDSYETSWDFKKHPLI